MIRIVSLLLLLSLVFAENLNIINGAPEADIYVDGVFVGKQTVNNLNVEPGSHIVKVSKRGTIVFTHRVEIMNGQTQTIDTTRFVDVPESMAMPSRGPRDEEALRVRDARGDIGFGFYVGPIGSGISMRYFPMRDWGLQLSGWWSGTLQSHYQSMVVRPIFVLVNTLAAGKPMTLYTGVGFGRQTASTAAGMELREQQEVLVGAEFPAVMLGAPLAFIGSIGRQAPHNKASDTVGWLGFGGIVMSLFENAYATLELGFQRLQKNQVLEYEGVRFSGGILLYF